MIEATITIHIKATGTPAQPGEEAKVKFEISGNPSAVMAMVGDKLNDIMSYKEG